MFVHKLLKRTSQLSSINFKPIVQRLNSSNTGDNVIDPPDESAFNIPRPTYQENEPLETKKARLIYQSRKRGMLENDLLLSTFAAKYLDKLTPEQVSSYDKLINGPSNDWDIYYWLTDIKEIPEEYNTDVMSMLKLHCKNINRESRIRQPDLE